MGVPEHIRKVERPKNTIVDDSGREGENRYSVRERSGVKYIRDGNPQPRNGRVIGHIINGRFVPLTEKISNVPSSLSYGAAALAKSISDDIFEDLLVVYPPNEASAIMVVAMLKALRPGIATNRYSTYYERTFVSKYYPNVALSKNTVGSLFKRLGMDGAKRKAFYASRVSRVAPDHHIAIDRTLKQNTRTVNDLSSFSHKTLIKGSKDVSLLYAYVMETGEPLCAEVFPGANIGASSITEFITDNNITKGILLADKESPISFLEGELSLSQEVYKGDEDRLLLELLFSQYLGEAFFDSASIQDDYSLIGAEFVNFVATIMTFRMMRKAGNAKLLDVMTYGDLMEDLSSAWRLASSTGLPRSADKKWIHTLPSVLVLLEKLGLSEPLIQESKKVGRPRKVISDQQS